MNALTQTGIPETVPSRLVVIGRKNDALSRPEKGHITYEVYVPLNPDNAGIDEVDTHGEYMLPEDLYDLAADFMVNSQKVSVNHLDHGGELVGVNVVESFINDERFESPHVYPGAWVATLDFSGSPELLQKAKSGVFKTVSWTCTVMAIPVDVPSELIADDPYGGRFNGTLSVPA